ncbi:Programmed cell death protein 5, partial [Heterocephalus glaber]
REAEMRNSILAQVLDQSARARLSNLALVKPEKTKAVENYLIQMAKYGQLSGKVSLGCLERTSLLPTFYHDMASPGQIISHY